MSADKRIARIFTQLAKSADKGGDTSQPTQQLADALTRVSDTGLKATINRAAQAIRCPTAQRAQLPPHESVAVIQPLISQGLIETSGVTFTALAQSLKSLAFEAVLPLASSSKCLAAWIKAARPAKKQLLETILANPELAWNTPALDWYADKSDLAAAPIFLSNLLTKKPRPKHLAQWDEIISARIQKTKGAAFLEAALLETSTTPPTPEALATLVAANPDVASRVADLLPALLNGPSADGALAFTRALLERVPIAPSNQLPGLAAATARLASGILLQDPRATAQSAALACIADVMSRLRLNTTDEDLKSHLWIMEPLKTASARPSDDQNLTLTGARYLAVAFEKTRQGLDANGVISMLAKNLGLTPIGTKGDLIPYNPIQHQDFIGGIIPGETVQITTPGWTFRNSVILRALVSKPATPTPSNV